MCNEWIDLAKAALGGVFVLIALWIAFRSI
jgi:hypothetical protein